MDEPPPPVAAPPWRPRIAEGVRLKYLGIVEALAADIASGRIGPGERLPPQRTIAEALGIDLTTVTRALNEARRRGLIEAQAGRGTFVRDRGSVGRPPPLVDLGMNIPPQPAMLRRAITAGTAEILAAPGGMLRLHYQEGAGTRADRRCGAEWLRPRLVGAPDDRADLDAERLVVAAGAQAALYAVVSVLARPGDVVAAGRTTYPGLMAVAAERGLALAGLAMDADGVVPEDFARLCAEQPPRLLYLVPSIDNPTTATLPLARRRAIVEIARGHGVAIIEDDPYAPLAAQAPDAQAPAAQAPAALAALAPEITWHVATLSKCATPALRVAYVVAPSAADATRLAACLRATTLMAPPLAAALASRWIGDGTLAAATEAIRAENRARQACAAALLGPLPFAADPNGSHLWLPLPRHWPAATFAEHADRAGVSIVAGSAFAVDGAEIGAVRLSLGVAPDRGALEDALTLLADLAARPPAAAARAIV